MNVFDGTRLWRDYNDLLLACKHVSGLNGFYRQIRLISRCYRDRLEFRTV